MKALPDTPFRLYGEPANARDEGAITIFPPHCIKEFQPKLFDLVLNQDSFPEIHAHIVRDYLTEIVKISRSFLSINHESCPPGVAGVHQIRVQDIIEKVGGYQRLWRVPYWLRRGYVMELYKI